MQATRTWNEAAPDRIVIDDSDPVRVGMPELCRNGLSENWLWKACGHRHWLALAAAHGLARPDFRNRDGDRLYPAFIDVELRDARLNAVEENDVLSFTQVLERTGRTRFRSIIAIASGSGPIAEVAMETAFVGRRIPGSNRAVERSLPAAACVLPPPRCPAPPFRVREWERYGRFVRTEGREIARTLLDPNPNEDFNGAHFLYFASFQAMVDRAEWSWLRMRYPFLSTVRRRVVFTGNVELGERIGASFWGFRGQGDRLSHWVELSRESDGTMIGLAFTDKQVSGKSPEAGECDRFPQRP